MALFVYKWVSEYLMTLFPSDYKHLVKAEQVSSFNIVSVRLLSVVSAGDCLVSLTFFFVAMYPIHKRNRIISVGKATVLRAGRSRVRVQVKVRDVCFPQNVQAFYL